MNTSAAAHNTVQSLKSYVTLDDVRLSRKQFLFTVATRILDDLHIHHDLVPDFPEMDDDRQS